MFIQLSIGQIITINILQVDTVVGEQTFSWLSPYSRIMRHMNKERFFFYLLYSYDCYNRRKISNKPTCNCVSKNTCVGQRFVKRDNWKYLDTVSVGGDMWGGSQVYGDI